MKCYSYLEKAARKTCMYCKKSIGYEEYGFVTTKSASVSVKGKTYRFKSMTNYFHMKCHEGDQEQVRINNIQV